MFLVSDALAAKWAEDPENPRKGKVMKTIIFCLSLLALAFLSCREKSTEVQTSDVPPFSAYTSNCIGSTLARSDGSETDSVFLWSFGSKLVMDFSYRANCCLDSSDFSVSRNIEHDTVTILVVDTVDMGCRCPCIYMAHVELADLPDDSYTVRVHFVLMNMSHLGDPIHTVRVMRSR
jgi:hypothetical protein